MLRVTSELWVSALIKRSQSLGAFSMVLKRGAKEAGAIYIIVRQIGGAQSLFGPAPQSMIADDHDGERQFEPLMVDVDDQSINDKLDREKSFDPDIWIVELESADETPLFEVVTPI